MQAKLQMLPEHCIIEENYLFSAIFGLRSSGTPKTAAGPGVSKHRTAWVADTCISLAIKSKMTNSGARRPSVFQAVLSANTRKCGCNQGCRQNGQANVKILRRIGIVSESERMQGRWRRKIKHDAHGSEVVSLDHLFPPQSSVRSTRPANAAE
jgi:hypothetical protein